MVLCISVIVPINSGGIYWNVLANAAFKTVTPTPVNYFFSDNNCKKIKINFKYLKR